MVPDFSRRVEDTLSVPAELHHAVMELGANVIVITLFVLTTVRPTPAALKLHAFIAAPLTGKVAGAACADENVHATAATDTNAVAKAPIIWVSPRQLPQP